MRRHRQRQRGLTLIEIMISLAMLTVAILGTFSTIGSSILGTSTASKLGQAQLRAQAILEAVRLAPSTTLTCLTTNAASAWSICEADCKAHQTGSGSTLAQGCIFTTASFSNVAAPPSMGGGAPNQSVDRSGGTYSLVYNATTPLTYRSTFVLNNGPGNRLYDAQITVGYNDDAATATPNHYVTLRSGVFN